MTSELFRVSTAPQSTAYCHRSFGIVSKGGFHNMRLPQRRKVILCTKMCQIRNCEIQRSDASGRNNLSESSAMRWNPNFW